MSAPVTQAQIELELVKVMDALEDATANLEALADARSMAKYEYEMAYSKALLEAAHKSGSGRNGSPTVDEREAMATLATDAEYKLHLLEDGKYDARKRYIGSLEQRLSALQTLARVIAPQAGMGR